MPGRGSHSAPHWSSQALDFECSFGLFLSETGSLVFWRFQEPPSTLKYMPFWLNLSRVGSVGLALSLGLQ